MEQKRAVGRPRVKERGKYFRLTADVVKILADARLRGTDETAYIEAAVREKAQREKQDLPASI